MQTSFQGGNGPQPLDLRIFLWILSILKNGKMIVEWWAYDWSLKWLLDLFKKKMNLYWNKISNCECCKSKFLGFWKGWLLLSEFLNLYFFIGIPINNVKMYV